LVGLKKALGQGPDENWVLIEKPSPPKGLTQWPGAFFV
jgi:hypothetical protein